ncbi:unnamed protein product, partial [Phaeothamnion confervicola]
MAAAYQYYAGPKQVAQGGIVRGPSGPVKSAPAERGGKQMANAGSPSLNNRLPSEGNANSPGGEAPGVTDSNGVRRVSTVAVGREPPQSVPGLVLAPGTGGFPSASGAFAPSATAPLPPPQRQAAVPIASVPASPARAQPVAREPQAATPPSEPATAPPARQKLAARDPAAAAPDRPKPSGVVAVLGYQRSQLEAMRTMADLQ